MPAPAPLGATSPTWGYRPRSALAAQQCPTGAVPQEREWCWGAPRAPQPPLGDRDQAPRGTQSTEGCSRVAPSVLGVSPGCQDGSAKRRCGSATAACRAGGADNTERCAPTVQAGQGWLQAKPPWCGRTPALPSPLLPARAPSAPGYHSTRPPRSHWSPGCPRTSGWQEPAHLLEGKHTAQPWAERRFGRVWRAGEAQHSHKATSLQAGRKAASACMRQGRRRSKLRHGEEPALLLLPGSRL